MGNKSQRSSSVTPVGGRGPEPFIYYFHRKTGEVFFLKDLKIEKKTFGKDLKIPKDSGIGYLNDFSIITIGGSKDSGSLKKSSFIIDMDQMFIRNIHPPPVRCKLGSIHSYRSFLYFAGGCRKNEDPSVGSEFLSLPLMRYKILENYWEVFDGSTFGRAFNYNVSRYGFNVDTLMESASFIYNGKFFYFAGRFLNGEPNFEVFSLDLSGDSEFLKESFRLSEALFSPICLSNNSKVLIYGGKNLEGSNLNILQFNSQFLILEGRGLESSENYPGKLTDSYIIQVAYPKFAIQTAGQHDWTFFNLSGSNFVVSSTTVKAPLAKGLPPATPRGRLTNSRRFEQALPLSPSSQLNRVNSPTLHISCMTVQERSVESKKNNSPIKNSNKEESEVTIEEVISKNSDCVFKVTKKLAVRVVTLLLSHLDHREINALASNAIWSSFGMVLEVTIEELSNHLINSLKQTEYEYQQVKRLTKIIYKNSEHPKVRTIFLNNLLEAMQVPEKVSNVSKETAIFILTRMVKAIASSSEVKS
jgi:hypothetical protein